MDLFWPYLLVFLGMFVEGELVLVSAVIAAQSGYTQIAGVMIAAMLGIISVDSIYYLIGRHQGRAWIMKKEQWRPRVEMVEERLKRSPFLLFMSYRFMYGLRGVISTIIGVAGIPPRVFFPLSLLSAALWAAVYSTLGYLFGSMIETYLSNVKHIEKYVIAALLLIGITVFLVHRSRNRSR